MRSLILLLAFFLSPLAHAQAIRVYEGKHGGTLGSASLPSFYFIGDPNTGIYSSGADTVNITTGGTSRVQVDSAGAFTVVGDRWSTCTSPATGSGTTGITLGTGGTLVCKRRRSNDTMLWEVFATFGTGGSVTTNILVNTPDSLSIDATKTPRGSFARLGLCYGYDVSANVTVIGQATQDSTSSQIRCLSVGTGATQSAQWNATVPFTWASGDEFHLSIQEPISGW